MKNFEVRYLFDGGRWFMVIAAETEGQAVDYLLNNDSNREIVGVKQTAAKPDLIVPAGWQRPGPPALPTDEEIELNRMYNDWAWARCKDLDMDPEDCDVDFETWLREVHRNAT